MTQHSGPPNAVRPTHRPTARKADAEAGLGAPVPIARFAAGPRVRAWARKNGVADWRAARLVKLAPEPAVFLEGLLKKPPRYLRANPLRIDADALRIRMEAKGFELIHSDLDVNVMRIRRAPMGPGATEEHMKGLSTPQDLASASAPVALGAQPGDIVADLAAAPGVKTVHVAGDLAGRGAIVAAEPDTARIQALRFNLERCGVTTAVVRNERAEDLPGDAWADKVLLDAPCTGEGTLPKDKARRQGTPEEIQTLCRVQGSLVAAADRVLKPGGILVYATCTFAPEENEVQVQALLERGYKMERLPFDSVAGKSLVPGVTEWPGFTLDPELKHARRFLPGIHPTLGFFVARLRKGGA